MLTAKKISIIFLVLGLGVGSFFLGLTTAQKNVISGGNGQKSVSAKLEEYNFINKAKVLDLKKHYIIDFSSLRSVLDEIRKKYNFKTYIYFNYLNNGSWVGINEREKFSAASLVKVPLAMAVLKAVEDGKLSLNQSYALEELNLDAGFGELYKSGAGNKFSIRELIKIMLVQSDNTARSALFTVFERIGISDPLSEVYSVLGWELIPEILPGQNQTFTDPNRYNDISLKVLSNMLLALYSSTYVTIDHSQEILEYLADTPFNEKLRAGVPEEIPVTHKMGIAAWNNTFSDCGIVYAPNRHYLLCLGLSGGDEKLANKFMAEVSAAVYKYVINN